MADAFALVCFWSINIGLALMVLLSLLPVGLAQTWASFEHGMWYARSAEFLQTPVLEGVPLAPLHRGAEHSLGHRICHISLFHSQLGRHLLGNPLLQPLDDRLLPDDDGNQDVAVVSLEVNLPVHAHYMT